MVTIKRAAAILVVMLVFAGGVWAGDNDPAVEEPPPDDQYLDECNSNYDCYFLWGSTGWYCTNPSSRYSRCTYSGERWPE